MSAMYRDRYPKRKVSESGVVYMGKRGPKPRTWGCIVQSIIIGTVHVIVLTNWN